MKPRFTLKEVFKIIDSGDINQTWFSAPSRSYRVVIRIYERSQSPKNPDQAMAFILAGIKELTDLHFVKTVFHWEKPADVYGLIYNRRRRDLTRDLISSSGVGNDHDRRN